MGFDLGRIFGQAFRVFVRHGAGFSATTALVLSPTLVAMLLLRDVYEATQQQPQFDPETEPDDMIATLVELYRNIGIFNGTVAALEIVLTPVATAFIVLGTFRFLRGREFRLSESFSQGLRHILPLALFGLLVMFGVSLGFLLCCLPGLFLAVIWSVGAPAIVVESLGPLAGLRRSWQLVKPRIGWVLLTLVLLYLMIMVPGIIVGVASFALGTVPTLVLSWLMRVLTVTLSAVLTCVLYAELRRLAGSLDDDDYGEIFA